MAAAFWKSSRAAAEVAGGAGQQGEVEPGAGALRIALDGLGKDFLCVLVLAHVEQGDSHVEATGVGSGVQDAGRLEVA